LLSQPLLQRLPLLLLPARPPSELLLLLLLPRLLALQGLRQG
jgi:hypothetical protein